MHVILAADPAPWTRRISRPASAIPISGSAHSAFRGFSALVADWSDQTFSTAASRPDRIASANA